jgi:uncharacterized protein YoxC
MPLILGRLDQSLFEDMVFDQGQSVNKFNSSVRQNSNELVLYVPKFLRRCPTCLPIYLVSGSKVYTKHRY